MFVGEEKQEKNDQLEREVFWLLQKLKEEREKKAEEEEYIRGFAAFTELKREVEEVRNDNIQLLGQISRLSLTVNILEQEKSEAKRKKIFQFLRETSSFYENFPLRMENAVYQKDEELSASQLSPWSYLWEKGIFFPFLLLQLLLISLSFSVIIRFLMNRIAKLKNTSDNKK